MEEPELESYAEKLKEISKNPILEERLHDIQEFIKTLYLNCDEKLARILTINLIILTNKWQSNADNVNNDIYKEIYYRILSRYQSYVYKKCKNLKVLKKMVYSTVPNDLWEKCILILKDLDIKNCSAQIDKLLQISRPENKVREGIITKIVKEMIDSEDREELKNGVTWISMFNLEKSKAIEFRNIAYKSYIYQMPEVLTQLLTTKRFNEDYLLTLDGCYERLLNGKPSISQLESDFIETTSLEALSELIHTEAERLEVDMNRAEFHVYYLKVTNELRQRFLHDERSMFEIFALNTLNSFKRFSRSHFINILSEDPKYAFCWTKMLNLETNEIPDFVQQLGDQYEAEADKFITSMKVRIIEPKDSVEVCTILGKEYKIIMIATPEGLKNFLREYFIDSKPDVLGIDSEAYKFKLSLIQLATKEWCCIIDVFFLSKHLSPADWTVVFQHIFNPTITRIGFAFHADYNFIEISLPHVSSMLKEENRKVLCLSTLSKIILDSPARDIVFSNLADSNQTKLSKNNVSLADVSKAVLDIKLCKDQQCSDWNWRPLTEEQKIYAVTDAIVVILIKEKIESDLIKVFGEEKTAEIMELGNIYHKSKPKKGQKIKRGTNLLVVEDVQDNVGEENVIEDQEN